MDSTTLLIVFVIVSIIGNFFTAFLQSLQMFIKLIKKSTCCGSSSIEMKASPSSDKMSPTEGIKLINDKTMDIIIDRLDNKK